MLSTKDSLTGTDERIESCSKVRDVIWMKGTIDLPNLIMDDDQLAVFQLSLHFALACPFAITIRALCGLQSDSCVFRSRVRK